MARPGGGVRAFPPPVHGDVAWVAGGSGFIGSHVVAALAAGGWRVATLGRPRAGGPGAAALPLTGEIDAAMLAEAEKRLGRPSLIVNAAGGSVVARSIEEPADDARRTVGLTLALLAHLRARAPEARLVLLSSAAVYGSGARGPLPETAPPAPISPYGLHKLTMETLATGWARLFDLDVAILRFFSVYGPRLRKQLFWDVARRLAAGAERLELGGTGTELRDFLHVTDAVALVARVAAAPRDRLPAIVNGGTGSGTEVRTAVEAIARAFGRRPEIRFTGEVRRGDPPSLVADLAAARALGFEPAVGLDEGLADFAGWFASLPKGDDGAAR